MSFVKNNYLKKDWADFHRRWDLAFGKDAEEATQLFMSFEEPLTVNLPHLSAVYYDKGFVENLKANAPFVKVSS